MRSWRSRLSRTLPYEHVELFGLNLSIRVDSVKAAPDYDDAWCALLTSETSLFLDVGCNVGFVSLVALAQNPLSRVIALDANASALAVAADNIIRNGFANRASFVHAFADSTAGEQIAFYSIGVGAAGTAYPELLADPAKASVTQIPTTTLDSLCNQFGETPDLVKIDVEGAELSVLKGSEAIAVRGKTRFLVELHTPAGQSMEERGDVIVEWAAAVDLQPYYLKHHSPLTSGRQIADRGRCHVLLQPADWPYPSGLDAIEQGATLVR